MLSSIHQLLFYLHVSCGSVGLIVFWLPMLSKKGSRFHKSFGKVFTYGMFAVSISGIIMSLMVLIDPIGIRFPDGNFDMERIVSIKEQNRNTAIFLLMLSMLVFTNVKHSIFVLKAKGDRLLIRNYTHLISISLLFITGVSVGYFALISGSILFIIFSALSVVSSISLFWYVFKTNFKKREWLIEHLTNIIGSGIGTYTAFFAFGGRRFLGEIFTGQLQLIPWILPSIIGGVASVYLAKKYRQQYRVV